MLEKYALPKLDKRNSNDDDDDDNNNDVVLQLVDAPVHVAQTPSD
jgi:hypothetical protein